MKNLKPIVLCKNSIRVAVITTIIAALLMPKLVFAVWPQSAFESKDIANAVKQLLGDNSISNSNEIKISAPAIAENGSEVGIAVQTKLPQVDTILIFVEENTQPLVASFRLSPDLNSTVRTRIKIAKTSNVYAVVRSNGKLFSTKQKIKVTIGGCGGGGIED